MGARVTRVAVTGAAGQIAYSLLFRIASAELLGPEQPIALHLLEIPAALPALQGLVMELEDCAFPLLEGIVYGTDAREVFADIDIALLVGAKPRGPGMERKDLLAENAKIFREQGEALNAKARRDAVVFVVGNPCNTNCLIALHHAPKLNPQRFFAMTRLDANRAAHMLATKAGAQVRDVSRMAIWGNHSSTQVPDFLHAQIRGRPAEVVIGDRAWLEKEFVPGVQQRGAAVIKARGKSSAASAASAAIDSIRSLMVPTEADDWFSVGLLSNGNPYGIEEDVIFSFPCRSKGNADVEIVSGLEWDAFLKGEIAKTERELREERAAVEHLL